MVSLQEMIDAGYLLKEAEASEFLRVEIATLRRWRFAKRGPRFVKIGSAVRYDIADLVNFIDAGRCATRDQGFEAGVR
jgi:hypothetical protein